MANLDSSRHLKFIQIISHEVRLTRILLYMLVIKEERMAWNVTMSWKSSTGIRVPWVHCDIAEFN